MGGSARFEDDFRDAEAVARAFLAAQHPTAAVAVLGGSVATGNGTPRSDIDLVLLYDDPGVNYAETVAFRGRIVETFVHSRAALDEWFAKERSTRRPVMYDIWARGIVLVDDGSAGGVQENARSVLAAGPEPLETSAVDLLRYATSSSLDDLRDRVDGGAEGYAVTAEVFDRVSTLLLATRHAWVGHGKWLIRRLQLLDDPLARELFDWAESGGSSAALVPVAERILIAAGGYLQTPFLRGTKPDS
jgi:predicted nucleotidyltransferase